MEPLFYYYGRFETTNKVADDVVNNPNI